MTKPRSFPIVAGLILLAALMVTVACQRLQSDDRTPGVSAPPAGGTDGMATTESIDVGIKPISDKEQVDYQARVDAEESDAKVATSRNLNVIFTPQVPPGSWGWTMSCGPTALNMASAYLWRVTPDQVRYVRLIDKYLGKTDIDNCRPNGTTTSDLVRAAKAVNGCPNTYLASGWTLNRIRQEIDAGRPVVVAVWAARLPNRGYNYGAGHFVLVVGYENGYLICHDPGTSRGASKRYSNNDFTSAMGVFGGAVVVVKR